MSQSLRPATSAEYRPMHNATRRSVVVPLTYRVGAMMVFRAVVVTILLVVGGLAARPDTAGAVVLSLGYLALAGTSVLVLFTRRVRLGAMVFSSTLLLDSVYLQFQLHRLGNALAADLALAAFLVAACLLASFRTGLKVAVWQSLVMIIHFQAQEAQLVGSGAGLTSGVGLLTRLVLIWVVVITVSSTAAINERELRRRRYDAEALREYAALLHECARVEEVCDRMVSFARTELGAPRALVCRRAEDGLELIAGHGVEAPPGGSEHRSALLDLRFSEGAVVLAQRLDPARDPWLAALVPGARRVVAVSLARGGSGGPFLVFQQGDARGIRVEHRVLSTCVQAAATTALALSRASLLEQAQAAAATDGLTGVLNRRCFDQDLAWLVDVHRTDGRPFSVVMVDIDHFKQVNDGFGHLVGDQVLKSVAQLLRDLCGSRGATYRYGGEEFAVLLRGMVASEALDVAEAIRSELHRIHHPVPITASFGVAAAPEAGNDGLAVVAAADAALLRAKAGGRDRVIVTGARMTGNSAVPGQRPAGGAAVSPAPPR